jgi:hypothetical protein
MNDTPKEQVEDINELSKDTIDSLARKRSIEANNETNREKRAKILKKVDKAKFRHADAPDKVTKTSPPKATNVTGTGKSQQWGFGANKGYGQGHYMGDSVEQVEVEDQLDEAHKLKDEVVMSYPSLKGVKGRIGEIRHGAYKGAPKTYTIDYQHPKHPEGNMSSIQLSSDQFKAHKPGKLGEEVEEQLEEGILSKISGKIMGTAPEKPKYKVGQVVSYQTNAHQPEWKDGGSGKGEITKYSNGHYTINGNPVNHFEIKKVHEEVESLDELSKNDNTSPEWDEKRVKQFTGKKVEEEVESLDELSMDTVKSYKEKVSKNPAPSRTTSDILHKAIRRFAGKERAEDRIHHDEMVKMRARLGIKEEIEQVEEGRFLKPKTEKPPKSTATMSLNQLLKNKKENPGQSPFKTQDDKVKKYLGEVEETLDESDTPDRMKGKQKPYVSSDGKGNYEVLGNTGQTKATFSRATHGKDAHVAAQRHLRSKYNEYMKEETLDEASHAEAFKSETDSMKPGTKKYVGRKDNKEVHAKKDEQGNVKFYHKDGIKGQLKSVQQETLYEAATPSHKVGDTVYATSPTNKALTMTGKVTKIGATLTTVKHKDGSEGNYPHKLIGKEYSDLHTDPAKKYKQFQREHLEQTGELLTLTEVKYIVENANGGAGVIAQHGGIDGRAPENTGKAKKMMGNKTSIDAIVKIIAKGAKPN